MECSLVNLIYSKRIVRARFLCTLSIIRVARSFGRAFQLFCISVYNSQARLEDHSQEVAI